MAAKVICKKCSVWMKRERNGLKVKLEGEYCQRGDLFKCPICGVEVLSDLGDAYKDMNPDKFALEIRMLDKERERLKRLRDWAENP
jgi:hypothetical protein